VIAAITPHFFVITTIPRLRSCHLHNRLISSVFCHFDLLLCHFGLLFVISTIFLLFRPFSCYFDHFPVISTAGRNLTSSAQRRFVCFAKIQNQRFSAARVPYLFNLPVLLPLTSLSGKLKTVQNDSIVLAPAINMLKISGISFYFDHALLLACALQFIIDQREKSLIIGAMRFLPPLYTKVRN
jgi:hypothetical protein